MSSPIDRARLAPALGQAKVTAVPDGSIRHAETHNQVQFRASEFSFRRSSLSLKRLDCESFQIDLPEQKLEGYRGAERDRTVGLLSAIQALSQLSYSPIAVVRGCLDRGDILRRAIEFATEGGKNRPVAPDQRSSGARTSARVRADLAVVEQGLAPSRERARALILAGEVLAGDRPIEKAGELVDAAAELRLRSAPMPYVSRGGLKLAHGLATFAVDVAGQVALDVGASTGGFTDCLLQAGARRVYCVDVGHGQLDWKIASDTRVRILDRTNIRLAPPDLLPEPVDVIVVDVSFISLRLVLPALLPLGRSGTNLIALVKPQFEVGRANIGKGGIVRDEVARARALAEIEAAASSLGYDVLGRTTSPITGGKGNIEFLLYLRAPAPDSPAPSDLRR